ncbi:MAG: hypothetical protein SGARI_002418, partial [Bacillariaceae sp.]
MTILHVILLMVAIATSAIAQTQAQTIIQVVNVNDGDNNNSPDIDCDPCIDRSQYRIRAIVHGRQQDPFWQDMQHSMKQTAKNMGIDFRMDLYEHDAVDISRRMATDIRNTAVLEQPHALIVSIPGDSLVERALESISEKVPIFVVNAMVPFPLMGSSAIGSEERISSNERFPAVHAATYMNETDAAARIALQLEDLMQNLDSDVHEEDKLPGVFISHESGIPLLTHRYNELSKATKNTVDWEMVDITGSFDDYQTELTELFDGCNYTVVQLAGTVAAEATLNALFGNGCDEEDTMIVGTYDTSPLVIDAIASGTIHFAISQQPRFQGSMSVMLASLYATTGQTLTSSRALFSRPSLITAENLPFDDQNKLRDKSKLNIKVLTHDLVTDPFWETVYSGLRQAASDFDVNLVTHRFKSAVSGRGEVSLERSFSVREACRAADIDGLIVSLPHDGMVDALSVCYARGIPVVAINAAPEDAIAPSLPYVGQQDYQSGFEAGMVLIENGSSNGYCL